MTQILWPSPAALYTDRLWSNKAPLAKHLEQVGKELYQLRMNSRQNSHFFNGRLSRLSRKSQDRLSSSDSEGTDKGLAMKSCNGMSSSVFHREDITSVIGDNTLLLAGKPKDPGQDVCGSDNLRSSRCDVPSIACLTNLCATRRIVRHPVSDVTAASAFVSSSSHCETTITANDDKHCVSSLLDVKPTPRPFAQSVGRRRCSEKRIKLQPVPDNLPAAASGSVPPADSNEPNPCSVYEPPEKLTCHSTGGETKVMVPAAGRVLTRRQQRCQEIGNWTMEHCRPTGRLSESESSSSDAATILCNDGGTLCASAASDGDVALMNSSMVAVPSWRIIEVPRRYVIEGTENTTDEAYLKRHQRPENDEKRRKRWDLQRQRELSLYEHLRRTDDDGSSATDRNCVGDDVSLSMPPTPDADSVVFVEVVDTIPTCAFGHPIPSLRLEEFRLPVWPSAAPCREMVTVGNRHHGIGTARKCRVVTVRGAKRSKRQR